MKGVFKGDEPLSLKKYRQEQPGSTWEQLRNDALYGGRQAYTDIRTQTHADQGGLCAYCEIDIRRNSPLTSSVEHFHPKSDNSPLNNWALIWVNMLAVCVGGSNRHGTQPHTMEPLVENLSCDAHKNHLIQKGTLPQACEGWILNPLLLSDGVRLFSVNKFNGELRANEAVCDAANPWPNNQHADIKALVNYTIQTLNLNCQRLCNARLVLIHDIERNKKKQRLAGCTSQQGLAVLARRYLAHPWPGFFTTICWCLGAAADDYLNEAPLALNKA